jgi:parallel beta-helix repeat protein
MADAVGRCAGGSDAGPVIGLGTGLACGPTPPIPDTIGQLYVSPSGSDSAQGTLGAPLRTLAEAVRRFADGGGTIFLRSGTYGSQHFAARGTTMNPLVIRSAPGEHAVLSGAGISGQYGGIFDLSAAENLVLADLEIANCTAPSCAGLRLSGGSNDIPGHNVILQGCSFHDLTGQAMSLGGSQLRVTGNDIYRVSTTDLQGAAIDIIAIKTQPTAPQTDAVIIRNNRVTDSGGSGVYLWFATHVVVEGNSVDGTRNWGVYLDNSSNVSVIRNFVRQSAKASIEWTTDNNTSLSSQSSSHDLTIANNVLVSDAGVGWWNSGYSGVQSTYSAVRISHNTIIAATGSAISNDTVTVGSAATGCSAHNNLISEGRDTKLGSAAAWDLAGNGWLNKAPPALAGATDVAVSATVGTFTTATDAQGLAANAGTGEPVAGVTDDFGCRPRSTTAPTRGAFER